MNQLNYCFVTLLNEINDEKTKNSGEKRKKSLTKYISIYKLSG